MTKETELLVKAREALEDAIVNCAEWQMSCDAVSKEIDNFFEEYDDGIFEE